MQIFLQHIHIVQENIGKKKTERDMIAFDHRESPLNYQDVLAKGKQLYADIYKKYKATQALEEGV